ncbi:MAG: TIGR03620 family F420-dependent LLM class oxidoreductase [Acidimicrobiia bacterium]|nr:TIGR03620 family F420-dependent LLM class oxidoreductase [Acidimicrobiia bacterium]
MSDSMRPELGTIGAWSGRLQRRPTAAAIEVVDELETLGYGSIWIPESPFGKDVLTFAGVLLGGSRTIVVATGIAIIWARDPAAMMNAGRTLGDAHPGRFLLGIGISHDSTARARGHDYHRPVTAMRDYLVRMQSAGFDGHGPAWTPPIVIAALGPRMLEAAAELADGAHPFLTTPDHTARARETLGPGGLLAVEQGVSIGRRDQARAAARENLARFLAWPNYRRHFLRLGFDESDLADGGSDRMLDAVFAIGDEDAVRQRVQQHLDAGADHVCLQVVTSDMDDEILVYRRIAEALFSEP